MARSYKAEFELRVAEAALCSQKIMTPQLLRPIWLNFIDQVAGRDPN